MSLSASHTVSFLGALEHHCVGPAGTQPDVPKNDPCWKRITEGWSWVVLSSEIDSMVANGHELFQFNWKTTD